MVDHYMSEWRPWLRQLRNSERLEREVRNRENKLRDQAFDQYPLRRIAYKLEPAKKLRMFVMGDYQSQQCLKPLHDYLSKILKQIPMDATYNQDEAAESFSLGLHQDVYCFDLKSATELIPVQIYHCILEYLFG